MPTALLSLVRDAERLTSGEDLSVEYLFVAAQIETASSPPPRGIRSYPAIVEPRAVRPDGVTSRPRPRRLQCPLPALHHGLARERTPPAPLLSFGRIAGAQRGCRP